MNFTSQIESTQSSQARLESLHSLLSKCSKSKSYDRGSQILECSNSIQRYYEDNIINNGVIWQSKTVYKNFLQTILTDIENFDVSDEQFISFIKTMILIIKGTKSIPDSPNYPKLLLEIIRRNTNIDEATIEYSLLSILFQFPQFNSSVFYSSDFNTIANFLFISSQQIKNAKTFTALFDLYGNMPNKLLSVANTPIYVFEDFFKDDILNNEAGETCAWFISCYLKKIGNYDFSFLKNFQQSKGIELIYSFLTKMNSNVLYLYILNLLMIAGVDQIPPNEIITAFICQELYQPNTSIDTQYYLIQAVNTFIRSNNEIDFEDLNNRLPISTLYNISSRRDQKIEGILLDLFSFLSENEFPDLTSILLSYLSSDYNMDILGYISQILATMNRNNLIVINKFNINNFVSFFINFEDENISLGEFLISFSPFLTLFYQVYENTEDLKNSLLVKLYETANQFKDNPDFRSLLQFVLISKPDETNLFFIMCSLQKEFNDNVFNALLHSLQTSKDVAKLAVENSCYSTLIEYLASQPDETNIVRFLIALTSQCYFNQINQYIASLPRTHKIHNLSEDSYHKLLGGKKRINPIRFPVFYSYVKYPPYTCSQFDLMNISIFAFPAAIEKVANRYVEQMQLNYFLSTPDLPWDQFYDLTADHFPVYEFMASYGSRLILLGTYSGVSFWVKIPSPFNSNVIIFTVQDLMISVKNNIITISWGAEQQQTGIPINSWFFIDVNSNIKAVVINDKKFVFPTSKTPKYLEEIHFGERIETESPWFVSFNIRAYQNEYEPKITYSFGPGSSRNDSHLASVVSQSQLLVEGVEYIPYHGISEYIMQSSNFIQFFKLIQTCEDSNQLYRYVKFILSFENPYFPSIIQVLLEKKNLISKQVYACIFRYISTIGSHHMGKFIYHNELWNDLAMQTCFNFFSVCSTFDEYTFFYFILTFFSEQESGINLLLDLSFCYNKDRMFLSNLFQLVVFTDYSSKLLFFEILNKRVNSENANTIVYQLPYDWFYTVFETDDDALIRSAFRFIEKLMNLSPKFEFNYELDFSKGVGKPYIWFMLYSLMTGYPIGTEEEQELPKDQIIQFPTVLPSFYSLTLLGICYSDQNPEIPIKTIVNEAIHILIRLIQSDQKIYFENSKIINILIKYCGATRSENYKYDMSFVNYIIENETKKSWPKYVQINTISDIQYEHDEPQNANNKNSDLRPLFYELTTEIMIANLSYFHILVKILFKTNEEFLPILYEKISNLHVNACEFTDIMFSLIPKLFCSPSHLLSFIQTNLTDADETYKKRINDSVPKIRLAISMAFDNLAKKGFDSIFSVFRNYPYLLKDDKIFGNTEFSVYFLAILLPFLKVQSSSSEFISVFRYFLSQAKGFKEYLSSMFMPDVIEEIYKVLDNGIENYIIWDSQNPNKSQEFLSQISREKSRIHAQIVCVQDIHPDIKTIIHKIADNYCDKTTTSQISSKWRKIIVPPIIKQIRDINEKMVESIREQTKLEHLHLF